MLSVLLLATLVIEVIVRSSRIIDIIPIPGRRLLLLLLLLLFLLLVPPIVQLAILVVIFIILVANPILEIGALYARST